MAKSGAAAMEVDFFNMEKKPKYLELGLSFLGFADIQHGISKMNLGVVKSVPSFRNEDQHQTYRLNAYSRNKNESNGPSTIFYNGTAENIVKLAKESSTTITASESNDSKSTASSIDHHQFVAPLNNNGDKPIARRKSQGRFLEKRRQRMTYLSPYVSPSSTTNSIISAGR
ncbi:hypothetical protein LIER_33971 [Lithospermum erythrorhizon]|uniref:Uncharacterized protein n=1 Tax=Lithospermum erythrorhizon TaxID=34254 RepID=A0AAV3S002_LITER